MKKILKWFGISIFALFVIGVIVNMNNSPEENDTANTPRKDQAALEQANALPKITAVELAQEYEANTVAANQKFKGKQFKVSGNVTNISTDFMGNPYVTMGGTNPYMQPQFAFDKSAADQLARINKGAKLTLVCKGKGDIAKTPISDSCHILQ